MCGITKIRSDVISLLEADPRFEGIKIDSEYPGGQRPVPVKKPVITVGIERVEAAPSSFGAAAGGAGDFPASGGLPAASPFAEVTVRFDCLCPQDEAFSCYFIDSLYECLIAGAGAKKLWSEPVKPEPAAMANRLRVFAALGALLVPQQGEKRVIEEITVSLKTGRVAGNYSESTLK